MRIDEHPFYILGITARSSRREILERAESGSAQAESDKIDASRIQVTHPARRVDAEVSWFPGLAPSKIRRIIEIISQDSNLLVGFDEELFGVDCLWTFNVLAYWLAAHADAGPAVWETAIPRLAENFENIDAGELLASLNADRSAAGLPQIAEISAVEDAIRRHGENTADSIPKSLIRCPQHAHVLAQIVERDTDNGESPACDFIGRIVDRYQILVQPILTQRGDRVASECHRALSIARASIAQKQSVGGPRMSRSIRDLEERLSHWGEIARPVQLLLKSRGLKDTHSIEIAKSVRTMSVQLANDFDLHHEARQITSVLYDVFKGVPELAEQLEQDLATLDGIIGPKHDGSVLVEELQGKFDFDDESATHPALPQSPTPSPAPSQPGKNTATDAKAPLDPPALPMTEPNLRLSEADTARALEIFRTEGEEGLRKFLETLYAPEAESQPPPKPAASGGAASARAFVQLCRSIRLECWQGVNTKDDHGETNVTRFEAAYRDYQRQVSPWLAIICDAHRGDTPVIIQVRNAAAECLNSLAGGFMCVNDFDTAQRLYLEAVPLVFDDKKLESEIKAQLDFIASERSKVPKPAPGASPRTSEPTAPHTPIAGSRGPRPRTAAQPLFTNLRSSSNRTRLVVVGIAVLIAIPLIFLSITGPQWQPQVTGTGPTGQEKTTTAVPAAPPHDPVSLANGTNLMRPVHVGGLGTLKISNYTDHDAAVKLKTAGGRTIRFVFVQAMSDVTIPKISPGGYTVQFTTGRDWDATELAFREDQAFAAFDQPLSYSDDGSSYSVYEITLHTVPNGNIRKRTISAEEFSDNRTGGGNGDK